jgi:CRP-like cAMP-binding protein
MAQQSLERISLEPGTRIFHEGEPGDKAYLVMEGMVEISKKVGEDETIVIATLGKGEIIGEMALIDDQPRAATARVAQFAHLMVITRDDMEARLARTDSVIRQLLKVFTNRLRAETSKTAERAPVIR